MAAPDSRIAFAECFTFTTATGVQYTWTTVDYVTFTTATPFLATGPLVSGLKYRGCVGLEVDKQQITIAARPTTPSTARPFSSPCEMARSMARRSTAIGSS